MFACGRRKFAVCPPRSMLNGGVGLSFGSSSACVGKGQDHEHESTPRSSFNRFRNDGEIHFDDLSRALAHCGHLVGFQIARQVIGGLADLVSNATPAQNIDATLSKQSMGRCVQIRNERLCISKRCNQF